jgi:hypothetical protein
MILLGSTILLAIGLLLLLVSVARIAFGLLKLAYYVAKLIIYLAVAAVLGLVLVCQWCVRRVRSGPSPEPEPVITINVYSDEEDAPTIELPRASFRRLRG